MNSSSCSLFQAKVRELTLLFSRVGGNGCFGATPDVETKVSELHGLKNKRHPKLDEL